MKIASSGALLWKIFGISSEEKVGKVRVMFSNRSQSAPKLEDNVGKNNFGALKSHVATHQDSGSSSTMKGVRKNTLQRTGGLCSADTEFAAGVAAVGTHGAPGPSSGPGTCG